MIQAKICGLTTPEQAEACAEAGAAAVGCVFYPKSPRHLDDATAREVVAALPDSVPAVGVFVDETYETIMKRVEACGLKGVQLHGREAPELIDRLVRQGLIVLKGLFAVRKPDLSDAGRFRPTAFLVECGKGKLPGGNAMAWDWGAARSFGERHPLVVAGGLSPENIAEAMAACEPDAVDVSSGVEAAPGVKDLDKVRAFLSVVSAFRPKRETRKVFRYG